MLRKTLSQMKYIVATGLLLFLVCETANSQVKNDSEDSPVLYFNNFQKFINNEPNVDSAFYYIKKLASNKQFEQLLKISLHDSFAQVFIKKDVEGISDANKNIINKRMLLSKELLGRIEADTT